MTLNEPAALCCAGVQALGQMTILVGPVGLSKCQLGDELVQLSLRTKWVTVEPST